MKKIKGKFYTLVWWKFPYCCRWGEKFVVYSMCEKFDFNVLRNGCGSCEESIDFVEDVTVHSQGFSPIFEEKVGESHET